MSLFKKRCKQFKEYLNLKNKENMISSKLRSKYREKNKKDDEYEKFKKCVIHAMDKMVCEGKSKIVIEPKAEHVDLFERLLEDREFKRYYRCRVIMGSQLEIEMIEV